MPFSLNTFVKLKSIYMYVKNMSVKCSMNKPQKRSIVGHISDPFVLIRN